MSDEMKEGAVSTFVHAMITGKSSNRTARKSVQSDTDDSGYDRKGEYNPLRKSVKANVHDLEKQGYTHDHIGTYTKGGKVIKAYAMRWHDTPGVAITNHKGDVHDFWKHPTPDRHTLTHDRLQQHGWKPVKNTKVEPHMEEKEEVMSDEVNETKYVVRRGKRIVSAHGTPGEAKINAKNLRKVLSAGEKVRVSKLKEEQANESRSALTPNDHFDAEKMSAAEKAAKHARYLEIAKQHSKRMKDPSKTDAERSASRTVHATATMAAAEWKKRYMSEEPEQVTERSMGDYKWKHVSGVKGDHYQHKDGSYVRIGHGKFSHISKDGKRSDFDNYEALRSHLKSINEDAEQIDELSYKTLGSYAKAVRDGSKTNSTPWSRSLGLSRANKKIARAKDNPYRYNK